MSFLPLAERELRVVSRRRATPWIRCGAAALGALFIFAALVFGLMLRQRITVGKTMFMVMSYYCFALCILAGAFMGADCIAEERREGTLGLLFLTDLRGYDVALGKFVAVSLHAFYGLLAILPVFGLCLLGGGLTGGEFARISLALLNTLFFSMALAALVSARAKSETRPVIWVLALWLAMWLGGAALDWVTTLGLPHVISAAAVWLKMASPMEAFSLGTEANYLYRAHDFWRALALSHAAGWLCLIGAAWKLDAFIENPRGALFSRRKQRHKDLLETNPIAWLLDDSRPLRIGVLLLGISGAVVAGAVMAKGGVMFLGYALWPFYFLLKLLFASEAVRFFAEGRRSGALELLRTTPLAGQFMVSGQWAAWRRVFSPAIALLAGMHIFAAFWTMRGSPFPGLFGGGLFSYKALANIGDFLAIGWFGMWMALVCRKPAHAAWLTILFMVLIPSALVCVPDVLIAAIVIAIVRDKVFQELDAYLKSPTVNPAINGR
ncbi:MAG TPA: ABC transporter permease subunit [Verrucomicrobiae bacterium]|jgi:ABC-type transport system involved in multi-copper enzyme maturation permease subunit|nr:ABC transporter permease subunit [Verrucomicrobiae bacterium]